MIKMIRYNDIQVMNQDMNTIYGQDICDYGAGKPRNCGDGFGKRKAVAAIRKDFSRFLRFAAVLLLMVVGVSGVYGQPAEGYYFIASAGGNYTYNAATPEENFYLRPTTECYYTPDANPFVTTGDMPYLTTYKCVNHEDNGNALWYITSTVVSNTTYYRFYHVKSGKYLTYNTPKTVKGNSTRYAVHLEEFAGIDWPTEDASGNTLFTMTRGGSSPNFYYTFKSKNNDKLLNVSNDNWDQTTPQNTSSKGQIGGIIGVYNGAEGSRWYFETPVCDVPSFGYNESNQVTMSGICETATLMGVSATPVVYYTNDGITIPDASSTTFSTPISLTADITPFKAFTEIEGLRSSIVKAFPAFLLGNTHPYLIQSTAETYYYLLPCLDNDNENADGYHKLNTNSLARPTIQWYFEDAGHDAQGIQCYYLVNKVGDEHVYYHTYVSSNKTQYSISWESSTAFSNAEDKDPYKFIISDATGGGYNFVPKNGRDYCIYKNGGNIKAWNVYAYTAKGDDNGRWNIIPAGNYIKMTEPISVSTDDATYYYKIGSVSRDGTYLVTGTDFVSSSTSNDEDRVWYVREAASDDWNTYYYIINEKTEKYLYQEKDVAWQKNSYTLRDKSEITTENANRFQFALPKSTSTSLYIVPRKLINNYTRTYAGLALRDDQNDYPDNPETIPAREDDITENKNRLLLWDFTTVDAPSCKNPVFEESEDIITISCITNASDIYYTIDGSDPTADDVTPTKYTNQNWPTSAQYLIRAYAKLKNDNTDGSNSDVVTLLNKPDIILKDGENVIDENTYTYSGSAKTPEVVVSITNGDNTVTAPTTPATYTVDYSNNTNARTATSIPTVAITDAADDDLWYIWNAESVDFNINRKTVTITANDGSKTYNGTALTEDSFTATDLETGDEHTFTVVMTEGSTITDVGTQPNVIATVDGVSVSTGTETAVGNYLVTTADGELEVTAKAVTITANNASKTYNGTALVGSGFDASALETGDEHTFTVVMTEGSTITDVGTQPNVIATVDGVAVTTGTETAVGNYLVTTENGTLTINPKSVTITASEGSKTYNGSALTETGFTASSLEEGDTHTFTVEMTAESTITNVGTKDNEIATVDGVAVTTGTETTVGNYKVTTAKGTLTINPKTVTITANDNSKVYDGAALTESGFTATDLETGDTHEFTVTMTAESTITNRGDQPNVIATVDGFAVETGVAIAIGNYLVTTVNGTLSVTGKVITITAGSDEKVYDGTALTNGDYTYDNTKLEEGDVIESVTVTGSQTVAGSSGNVASAAVIKNGGLDVTENYTIYYEDGTLTVTQRALTITADSETKVYDGTALTKNTYTITNNTDLATGDYIESVTITSSQTDVGTSDNVPTAAVIKNASNEDVTTSYAITFTKGTLTVTAKAVTITANDASKPYDGTELTETGFTTSDLETGDTHIFTVAMTAASTITNVGTQANVIATVDGETVTTGTAKAIGNYLVTTADGTLTISAKSIGNGALASGFTISFDTDNNIILKDGETTLGNTDYTIDDEVTISESGRYSIRTVRGTVNYGGYASIRNAIVTFTNDGNGGSEYSATFVAESADPDASPDPEKGHELPDGITAYTVTAINGNTVTTQELTYIPEGVPVLLLANTAIGGFLVQDVSGQTLPEGTVSGNLLKEVTDDSEHFDVKTIYLLYKNEFAYNKAGNLAKWKVYLDPTPVSPSRARLVIKWDTESGIDTSFLSPLNSQLPEKWYSFDGRRLNGKPTKKGLYIRNGQKVVIK